MVRKLIFALTISSFLLVSSISADEGADVLVNTGSEIGGLTFGGGALVAGGFNSDGFAFSENGRDFLGEVLWTGESVFGTTLLVDEDLDGTPDAIMFDFPEF